MNHMNHMSRKRPTRAQQAGQSRRASFIKAMVLVVCVLAFLAVVLFLWGADSKPDGRGISNSAAPSSGELAISGPPDRALPAQSGAESPKSDVRAGDERTVARSDILLVNAAHPLPDDYYPQNLVNLYEQNDKHVQLAESDIELCGIVFESMSAMFAAAQQDGVGGFIITSGYRTRDEQREIFNSTVDGTAARPGESEHETGLAFDVDAMGDESFERTPQFEWLYGHCAEYGFIIRYPQGKEDITGFPYEPWHFRYVGKEHAAIIMETGITLEQYCEEFQ